MLMMRNNACGAEEESTIVNKCIVAVQKKKESQQMRWNSLLVPCQRLFCTASEIELNFVCICICIYRLCLCFYIFVFVFLQLEQSGRLQRVHVCTFPVNEPLLPSIYLLTNNFSRFDFLFLFFRVFAVFLYFDLQFFQTIAVTYLSFYQQFELHILNL